MTIWCLGSGCHNVLLTNVYYFLGCNNINLWYLGKHHKIQLFFIEDVMNSVQENKNPTQDCTSVNVVRYFHSNSHKMGEKREEM